MGYTTEFEGSITISPPLNEKEIEYINKFSDRRRMNREKGPYYIDGAGEFGQGNDEDIIDYNCPSTGQPGLRCQWVVNEAGTQIEWDGNEKFYEADEWMKYIIDHFIKIDPIAKKENSHFEFLEGHVCNGTIVAEGEDIGDTWLINVVDNVVTIQIIVKQYLTSVRDYAIITTLKHNIGTKQMKKLSKPVFLQINTQEELNALQQAIAVFFDIKNDVVLDNTISTVEEVNNLLKVEIDEQREILYTRKDRTKEDVDCLIATTILKTKVEAMSN